jgi:hypothetical protein
MRRNAITGVLGCTALVATMITVMSGSAAGAAQRGSCDPTWREAEVTYSDFVPHDRYWYSVDHPEPPIMNSVSALSGTDARFAASQATWRPSGNGPLLHQWAGRTVDPAAQQLPVPQRLTDVRTVSAGQQSYSSPDEGWVVANTNRGGQNRRVAYHWHDGRWTMVPTAVSFDPLVYGLDLVDVASVSDGDAWLVGGLYRVDQGTLGMRHGVHIQRWDGTRWSIVDNPLATTTGAELHSVTARSADDVWAVGQRRNAADAVVPLVMHWDGARWSVVDVPTGATPAALYAVSAAGADNVWAVGGQTRPDGLAIPLAMQWNGTEWRVHQLPDVGNSLYRGVYAASPTAVWAVGYFTRGSDVFFLHWDGQSWHRVRPPGSASGEYLLDEYYDIHGTGPDNVWAVGRHWNASSYPSETPAVAHLSCGRNR